METLSPTRDQTLTALIEHLDQMVLAGNVLEAADRYFADDVATQQDNADIRPFLRCGATSAYRWASP